MADLRGNEGMDSKRAVLVGHAFVQGGDVSDSERKLSVGGGADQVPADHFAGLDLCRARASSQAAGDAWWHGPLQRIAPEVLDF